MFRRRFLSFPLVIGAVIIGVVSGKAIFAQPLDEYWKKKLQEEPAAKENDLKTRKSSSVKYLDEEFMWSESKLII